MGGLPKKAYQFEKIAEKNKLPTLKVDGGGLLFDRLPPAPYELEQKKITAAGIIKAYNRLGYAAVGVASLDLAGGLDFLQELEKKSRFAWLSANLVDRETGRTFFRPYISVDVGGARVAVIGLTGMRISSAGLLDNKAEIKSWNEVLPPLVAELERSHDFIVLLTDLSSADCLDLARQLPRLGLIVNASGENLKLARLISATTILAATDKQGRNFGSLEIFWNAGGGWSTGENYYMQLQDKQADLERTRGQIEQIRLRPEAVSRVGNMKRRADMLELEIGELKQKLLGTPASFFTNTFYSMVPEVANDPEIMALVEETKKEVSALAGEKAVKLAETATYRPTGFTGSSACGACHQPAMLKWRTTGHASAYTTLVRKNRQFDFDCLPCHVTGIDSDNADRVLALSPEFRGVSCEACHGPGRRHAESQEVKTGPVTEEVCRRCHVAEHDDHFNFAVNLPKIKCNR